MANLNPKRFTEPDVLRKIKEPCLVEWLRPARDYFTRRGVAIPANGSGEFLDYEKLAEVFMEPEPDMPEYLVDSLYTIHDMASDQGMDLVLEVAKKWQVGLDVGDNPDPADVAVQAWLQCRELIEELHIQQQLTRRRSFHYYTAHPFRSQGSSPDLSQLPMLEASLDAYYAERKRGRGCRVFATVKDGEHWFLVRHGLPCKREGTINDAKPASIFYRPQKHDVVVYNEWRREMRINCCGRGELEEFREQFGNWLFGHRDFFPVNAKYTLAPLVKVGPKCLAWGDIEGIEMVTLKEVEFFYKGTPWQKVVHKSDDVFALSESSQLKWPNLERISRATFEIEFAGSKKKKRRVTVIPPNIAMYGRDEDSLVVEQWLKDRGFVA